MENFPGPAPSTVEIVTGALVAIAFGFALILWLIMKIGDIYSPEQPGESTDPYRKDC